MTEPSRMDVLFGTAVLQARYAVRIIPRWYEGRPWWWWLAAGTLIVLALAAGSVTYLTARGYSL